MLVRAMEHALDVEEPPRSGQPPPTLFPPAIVPVLRERMAGRRFALSAVSDEVLVELLDVVFFAGLETEEGSRFPVRVVFTATSSDDVLLPHDDVPVSTPMLFYRWSSLPFEVDRPCSAAELVKLGVVTQSERVYVKVELRRKGLRIVGLAREGENREGDPYLKIVSPRPGVLSVASGADTIVEYDRGRVDATVRDVTRSPGVVRRRLETLAASAGVLGPAHPDYVATVHDLVARMGAHGRGGILAVCAEGDIDVPETATYRTSRTAGIAQLLHYLEGSARERRSTPLAPGAHGAGPASHIRRVLRGAFLREAERGVAELAGLTAMDGATIVDAGLAVRAFGVVLPEARDVEIVEALDADAAALLPHDLATHGARHRAAATLASKCVNSVVFVASQDGPIACHAGGVVPDRVVAWHLGSSQFHAR